MMVVPLLVRQKQDMLVSMVILQPKTLAQRFEEMVLESETKLETILTLILEMVDQILVFKKLDGTALEAQILLLTPVLKFEEMGFDLTQMSLIETIITQLQVMVALIPEELRQDTFESTEIHQQAILAQKFEEMV